MSNDSPHGMCIQCGGPVTTGRAHTTRLCSHECVKARRNQQDRDRQHQMPAPPPANDVWSTAALSRLEILWAETYDTGKPLHSTAEIGFLMGRTKNAVVGKVHRMGLPERPSPIRRRHGQSAAKPPRAISERRVNTLANLPSLTQPPPSPVFTQVAVAPPPPPAPVVVTWPGDCRFPIGEPGTKSFRFCDAPVEARGKSYCREHRRLCCIRVRDRREDYAAEAAA